MSLPPEPEFEACMAVVYRAVIRARSLALTERSPHEARRQVVDLLDAVHNIPDLIQRWEQCDEGRLRADLENYEARWGTPPLLTIYDDAIAGK